ncbi:transcriptional repressor LexA [Candidatus Contubernalis alkaliaceticus]|uniref:transcriptional repressor LexA n=1 Tax=Candidatus Contubernalis alkaliaceticus TaxID=338645 RepID=UPI001F4BF5F0|nr:transcriptional repressor LexA [Candidatus Contubernalis alkalaceticus]UNC91903.1 transcriptional repressor LexA [Candidatus Contubernalis alkalaceticus]
MTEPLTNRQEEILNFIKKEVQVKGYPPSVREIGKAVGLSSSSTVHAHLSQLEKKGYIRRDPTKPRAIELLEENFFLCSRDISPVPVVGNVTAGQPILAEENIIQYFPLPRDFVKEDSIFMLRVQGDSMINAGIFDGDYITVRQQAAAVNGDIVVALIDDEATVKTFYRENDRIRLQPENDYYEPIIVDNLEILGKVIGLFRKF